MSAETEQRVMEATRRQPPTPGNPQFEICPPDAAKVEIVRRVLSRGLYQLHPDELPYENAARAVVMALEAA